MDGHCPVREWHRCRREGPLISIVGGDSAADRKNKIRESQGNPKRGITPGDGEFVFAGEKSFAVSYMVSHILLGISDF